jgi:hypothetical protein
MILFVEALVVGIGLTLGYWSVQCPMYCCLLCTGYKSKPSL